MITCDCSCDSYDGPEVVRDKIVTARKEHRCCECQSTISKGEKYELVEGKWDGDWCQFKTCLTCVQIRQDYCPHGWEYGSLAEQIFECLGFNYY